MYAGQINTYSFGQAVLLILLDDWAGIVNTSFSIYRKCTIQVSGVLIA